MGILNGNVGGRTDFVVMRLADMMIAFPSLLLAMVVMYTLGAICSISSSPSPCRLGRGGAGGARADAGAEGEGIHRGRPGQRHHAVDVMAITSSQCGADLDRAFLAFHSRCDHVESSLSFLGVGSSRRHRAGGCWCRPARTICFRRRWWPWRQGWRSSSPCWRSISSATGCAMRSTLHEGLSPAMSSECAQRPQARPNSTATAAMSACWRMFPSTWAAGRSSGWWGSAPARP